MTSDMIAPTLAAMVEHFFAVIRNNPNESDTARSTGTTRGAPIHQKTMSTKTNTLTLMAAAAALAAHGQTAPSATSTNQPQTAPLEKAVQDIKKPVSWFSWDADLRLRNEYYNDARSLNQNKVNHEQDYFRIRPRLWTAITPVKGLSLNADITTEQRDYIDPSDSGAYNTGAEKNPKWKSSQKGYYGYDVAYGIVDRLNLQYTNSLLDNPFFVCVGRQDITLNDGWLVADGTPLDGSSTLYLDSAKVTFGLPAIHSTFDVIGIVQDADPNDWLPVINNQSRAVTEQDERGAIFNYNNNAIKEANLGAYFIYKGDTKLHGGTQPLGSAAGDDADIYTVGGRVYGLPQDNLKYSAEAAYQFGQRRDPSINQTELDPSAKVSNPANDYRDISAFGANAKATYMFKDSMDNQATMVYEFLSGDNNGTKKDEMFDVLWGRYPRWTDIYTYVYVKENNKIAAYNNYHRFGPTWSCKPFDKTEVSLTYNVLFADQDTPTRQQDTGAFTDTGFFRGQYVQTLLKYTFNSHVKTLLQGEVFFPGDFYTSDKMMSFVRAEVTLTF